MESRPTLWRAPMGLKMNTKNIAQRMNVVNIQLINELEQE